ncbi:MAG: family 1 glycosylhydrolase [Gaiellaceae bacterium]|jgi:beta-glucosidase/6-phospho-beta-glucosidase/beta-galactosidase
MPAKPAARDLRLPDGFRFGVATSAFQVEGGLNGPGEPANNWVEWERAGRVEPSGIAVDFWNRYEYLLDRAAVLGCDTFRLGLEWARVEPEEGQIDETALDRYSTILDACHERGLEPLATLHHFTHPAWLGEDFWLSPESPEHFAAWTAQVIDRLADRCRLWITFNELAILAQLCYSFGLHPPGRRFAWKEMYTAIGHMLAAHVRAYELIHQRRPDTVVHTNAASSSVYESDRLLVDLLLARSLGVPRDDLGAWISEQRLAWYSAIASPKPIERFFRRGSAANSPVGRLPRPGQRTVARVRGRSDDPEGVLRPAVDAIYSSPCKRTLDVLGIDYYDPVAANHVRVPGHRSAGGRSFKPAADLWDDIVHPAGLTEYARANLALSAGSGEKPLELWVVENGLCNRVRNGHSYERIDGWDRPRYLRENLAAVVAGLDAGLPIGAYLHWSLVDNYEWGSYQPRFGIHGVDRERGQTVLATDAMGRDSTGAYRRLIEGLRAGDRSALDASG